jgi:hypothetical protein
VESILIHGLREALFKINYKNPVTYCFIGAAMQKIGI